MTPPGSLWTIEIDGSGTWAGVLFDGCPTARKEREIRDRNAIERAATPLARLNRHFVEWRLSRDAWGRYRVEGRRPGEMDWLVADDDLPHEAATKLAERAEHGARRRP